MRISVLTLFPNLYDSFLNTSLIKRSIQDDLVKIDVDNLFKYSNAKQRIDSPTVGPGAGMLIKPDIVEKAVNEHKTRFGDSLKIFFSPHGKKLDQNLLKKISEDFFKRKNMIMLPARYEGMDARVEEHYADYTISLGDFVLMGGDLPAMVFMEGLLRLVPGVVSKEESVLEESFQGPFVDYPEYTKPVVWKDKKIPDILRSGDHQKISQWRRKKSIERTVFHHFNWLKTNIRSSEDINDVKKVIPNHYLVIMHDQVILGNDQEGKSSVTSTDIHDIARSALTFGFKNYFIVTSLEDQQKIVGKLLDFWKNEGGAQYNIHRHMAVKNVILKSSIDDVIDEINKIEGSSPVLIGTTAKSDANKSFISYYDQEKVWNTNKPVLFVIGTARGLGDSILGRCDFLIEPIVGFSDFNHLSVRSATAIICDRWLGINPVSN